MSSDTETFSNGGVDNELQKSNGTSSPWSVLSNRKINSSHDNDSQEASPEPVEPIAIIGMSCRLSGSATDPSSLWEMLKSGRTSWTPGPGRRFNMKAFQDQTGTKTGTTNTGGGHFLREDIAAFDASFFGINPAEANAMDPQHRLLLEIAYESFQNAGISIDSLWDSNTGVYVGQWSSDYHEIETRDIEQPPLYLVTGTGPAMASNRVSYFFNLRGPSFTVDTGCSSSLVSLHQAVQSLRTGETTQCFVGGVNVLTDPQRFFYQSRLKMLSKEGRSFAFDSRANGYGRGEGCTGVVLKPLSAALRDGDPIRGVIRNSVLNQDGRTPGISVPCANAQREAIQKAYRQANLDLDADYVEAHGTGTKVGDPIEVSAIAGVLSQGRSSEHRLPMGSIKGNLGHTESAAGLLGLIKAVLMLEHGMIPPQANFKTVNPDILLDDWNLRIPTKLERQNLRRISVNSFGYGGTNAHVVVDGLSDILSSSLARLSLRNRIKSPDHRETSRVFVISAASETACQRTCSRLAKYLITKHQKSCDLDTLLARLAYSLRKQSVHSHRVALIASNIDDLVAQLNEMARSPASRREKKEHARVALVFSGQGAQYAEMGLELLQSYPSFARSLERANKQLVKLGCSWDLLTELRRSKSESRVNEPAFSQPLSTAVQLALLDVLTESGISPCAAVGHSSGEIAAAYAAKAISLEEAMSAAYFRGQLASELVVENAQCPGAMLAVGAGPEMTEEYIGKVAPENGRMRIACYNSPSSVTVSGDATAIDQLKEHLDEESVFNRKLMTNGAAYHSHQMKLIEERYATALKNLSANSNNSPVRIFSSVTSKEVDDYTTLNGGYWVQNLVSPVQFSSAFATMCQQEYDGLPIDTILEVGPHSQMGGPVKQILKTLPKAQSGIAYTHTLKRGQNAEKSFLQCLSFLHLQNGSVQLQDINKEDKDLLPLVDLPPYPFDHDRTYWHESRLSKDYRHRPHLPHELLGTFSTDINRLEPRWRSLLSLKKSPWIRSHVVQGQVTFPAAGYITMAVQAIKQHTLATSPTTKVENIRLRDISFGKALVLSDDVEFVEIGLSLRPQARTAHESSRVWNEFRIFTVDPDEKWTEHCRGLVHAEVEPANEDNRLVLTSRDVSRLDTECARQIRPRKFYHTGHEAGLDWLDPFNSVSSIRTSRYCSKVTVGVPDLDPNCGGMGDLMHPAVLDSSLFHGLCTVILLEKQARSTHLPVFIKQLRIANRPTTPGADLHCTSSGDQNSLRFDVIVQSGSHSNSDLVLEAEGVRVTRLPGSDLFNQPDVETCHSTEWVTYMNALTPEYRRDTCNSKVAPGSMAEVDSELHNRALCHIQRTLKEITFADIPKGYHRNFFEWMQTVVSNESPDAPPISEQDNNLDLDLGAVGDGVARLGPHLSSILTGETDPLSLLTTDDLLSRIYSSGGAPRCYAQAAAYCGELGRQNSGLKVLEIGAGTGSTTMPVLQSFNERNPRAIHRYDFTDISPGFFEASRERLGDMADVVEFKVLNIEKDPQEQGFEQSSYDLIIASNVIHATRNISTTLGHIRPLLKPGGRFMLVELTRNTLYYNLVFGVLEGWWAGYDEGRNLSPLLTPPEWVSRLQLADFTEAEESFVDYSKEDGGTVSAFIASAPLPRAMDDAFPPVHLITTDFEKSKVSIIENQIRSTLGENPDIAISSHSLSMPSPCGNIVIMLPEVGEELCRSLDNDSWQSFKKWILGARAVLLVSSGGVDNCDSSMWTGFSRTLRLEHPDIRMVTLQVRSSDTPLPDNLASVIPLLLRSPSFDLGRKNSEVDNEFAVNNGQLFVARVFHHPEMSNYIHRSIQQTEPEVVPFLGTGRTMTAGLGIPGLLESFRWKDDCDPPKLGPDDIRMELQAASINFKDVLIAAGQLEGITEMQNDCSGVVVDVGTNMQSRFKPGDHVCALYSRSYTNYPVVHGDCCQIMPEGMSFAEGASLPIVWATVYYSLVHKGCLAKGDKILIHSAAGAVGQASVNLAQHLGAEVFVTVSSEFKRDLLHKRYGVPYDHMFSSRTTAFYNGIRRMTNGYGVDVVLNSLSGEMFRESCNLVAEFGRFVEIGRKDLMDDALMPMEFLLKNVTFAYVEMTAVFEQNRPLSRRLLQSVAELAAAGSIRPVTLSTMPMSEIETAFRQIQAGKHTGKIILTVEENQQVKAVPPLPTQAQFKPDASYAVVGGLGGLGRAIVSWMADHGARHILSLSRSGNNDLQSLKFIEELRAQGVELLVKKCDVSSLEDVARLKDAEQNEFPPIRGIMQSAMVLRDCMFEQMTGEEWNAALTPKVSGTKNLQQVLGSEVDFFVLLSSTVAVGGNVGQCNYSAACSFQDALARNRAAAGLPAYSINLGPVLEAGYVSENPEVAATLRRQGLGSVTIDELLALLNYAVTNPRANDPAQSVCSLGLVPTGRESGLGESIWMGQSIFGHLIRREKVGQKSSGGSVDLSALLSGAATFEDAVEVACQAILQQLGRLIATPTDMLSSAKSLDSYGVDSLVAVELRNWIGTYLQANVQLMVLRGTGSIQKLAQIVAKESRLVNFEGAAGS